MRLSLVIQYDADPDIGPIALLRSTDPALIRLVAEGAAAEAQRAVFALASIDSVAAFEAAGDQERAAACLKLLGT